MILEMQFKVKRNKKKGRHQTTSKFKPRKHAITAQSCVMQVIYTSLILSSKFECFVQGTAVVDQICANHNSQVVQGKPGRLADQATRLCPLFARPPPPYNSSLPLSSKRLPPCASFGLPLPCSIVPLGSTSLVFESLTVDHSSLHFLWSPAQMFLNQVTSQKVYSTD